MDLEEHTLEPAPTHCEECGTELTPEEIEAVIETGGPALCSIHAAELVDEDEEDSPEE